MEKQVVAVDVGCPKCGFSMELQIVAKSDLQAGGVELRAEFSCSNGHMFYMPIDTSTLYEV